MKVSKDFEYTIKDKLYRLCNRERYFTCGSNRQYDLMFSMAVMPEYTYRDIAMMIFTCSDIPDGEDVNSFFSDIQNQVETIYNDILECEAAVRMEEQQAQGERDADKAYCYEDKELEEKYAGDFEEFCLSFIGCSGCPYWHAYKGLTCRELFKADKLEMMKK